MDINTKKEEFSYAYIYAIASAAGYIYQRTTTPLDNLGVDLIITGIAAPGLPNFVPDRVNDWLEQTEAELCLKRCAYSISLEGASPTDNQETVTISIPRTNIFSAETLTTIMQRIATGRQL